MGQTPGPWHLEWDDDRESFMVYDEPPDENGEVFLTIAEVHVGERVSSHRHQPANARLIAAAPELLAALRRMREVFEQLADGDWRELDATYVDQLIESDGLLGCDQAIAKAEGRGE